MKRNPLLFLAVVMVVLGMPSGAGLAQESWPTLDEQSPPPPGASVAQPAPQMAPAPVRGKYQFLFFLKEQNAHTDAMWSVFQTTMQKVKDYADWRGVNILDPAEAALVTRYDLSRAPMPLVMAFAPNGAIMGGFPAPFDENRLLQAFGTPAQEICVKAFQEGKIVLLCVQNERTRMNAEALQGVHAFKTDPTFFPYTEVVMVNPADPAETRFLQQLTIDPRVDTARTAFMTPPGVTIGMFPGATDKETLVSQLTLKGCGENCQCLTTQQAKADSGGVLKKFFKKISGQ